MGTEQWVSFVKETQDSLCPGSIHACVKRPITVEPKRRVLVQFSLALQQFSSLHQNVDDSCFRQRTFAGQLPVELFFNGGSAHISVTIKSSTTSSAS